MLSCPETNFFQNNICSFQDVLEQLYYKLSSNFIAKMFYFISDDFKYFSSATGIINLLVCSILFRSFRHLVE